MIARPPSAAYKFQKAIRRNKLAFAAGTAVLIALVAGLGFATISWHQASLEKDKAVQARAGEQEQAESSAVGGEELRRPARRTLSPVKRKPKSRLSPPGAALTFPT